MPLAGSRDSVPCGVWGNAPTVPRATNSKEEVNKSAGSEASLPVTLRFRRSAPKPLYQPLAHCRARWARPTSIGRSRFSVLVCFVAGRFRLCGGDQRALRSPSGLLRIALPCFLIFHVTGGIAPAGAIRAQQNRASPFENALHCIWISLPDAPPRKRQRHDRRRSSRTAHSRHSWYMPCPR